MSTFAVARHQTGSMVGKWGRILLQIFLVRGLLGILIYSLRERGVGSGRKGGMGKRLILMREEKVLIIYSRFDPRNGQCVCAIQDDAALSSNIVSAISSSLLLSPPLSSSLLFSSLLSSSLLFSPLLSPSHLHSPLTILTYKSTLISSRWLGESTTVSCPK